MKTSFKYNCRLLFFLLLLLTKLVLHAQTIEKKAITIRYADNPPAFNLNTKKLISTNEVIDSIPKILKKAFYSEGYLAFSIDSFTISPKTIELKVFSGNKYSLKQTKINDNEFGYLSRKYIFKKKLSTKTLKSLDTDLLNNIYNHGYPYATIDKKLTFIKNQTAITYTVNKNQAVVFDSIIIYPKNTISYNFISRTTGIRHKKNYNPRLVQKIKNNINKSNFIITDTTHTNIAGSSCVNIIHLKQLKQNNFSAIVGIQPNNNTSEITGKVNIHLVNAFKKGESFSFDWQKPKTNSQLLETAFNFPFLLKSPFGVNAEVDIFKNDSLFTNTTIKAGIFIPVVGLGTLSANGKWQNSSINEISSDSLSSSTTNQYGIGYKNSQFDNFISPAKGWLFNLYVFTGTKTQQTVQKNNNKTLLWELQTTFDFAFKVPLGSIYVNNNISLLINDSLKLNNIYRIGGHKSIRGFNEKSILSKSFAFTRIEYRVKLNQESHLFLLSDMGYFQEPNALNYNTVVRNSLGFGLNLKTKAGYLTVAYAIGNTSTEPLNISKGKIHIGYLNRF